MSYGALGWALGCRRWDGSRSGRCGGDGGYAAWWSDGWDQGNGCRDGGDDAWVLGHVSAAYSGEVGKRALDLFLGGAPCLDATDDLLGEVGVRAEAAGVAVRLALRHEGEPGVDALGD